MQLVTVPDKNGQIIENSGYRGVEVQWVHSMYCVYLIHNDMYTTFVHYVT